jgi:tripeptide aminopeptidase
VSDETDLPSVAQRFLRYVRIDTQSDRSSASTPSTEKQKELGRLLVEELTELGIEDAAMDEHGYVYASLPPNLPAEQAAHAPVIALVAHVDTSPDEPGGPVRPLVHRSYDGSAITLPGAPPEHPPVELDPRRSPALLEHLGHDLITSDGSTLLGSDDKAGVAIIVQAAADLLADGSRPRPPLRLCFTVDEEIGRGVDELDLERLGADVAYTVDGGAVGEIDVETFNAAEAIVGVTGVNVHPGTAKGVMVNAATVLCRILDALPADETPESTEEEAGYFCPYRLSGTVAGAEARILLRDFTADGLERRKELVRRAAELARVRHPGATVEVTIEDNYKNMRSYIEEKDPRAIAFALAAGSTMGLELELERVRGGTDGARLSEMGLPTPNVFTGGHDYHSRFEWNTVQNLETALAYVKELVHYWGEHGLDPQEER